jgi:hypothetical protein
MCPAYALHAFPEHQFTLVVRGAAALLLVAIALVDVHCWLPELVMIRNLMLHVVSPATTTTTDCATLHPLLVHVITRSTAAYSAACAEFAWQVHWA